MDLGSVPEIARALDPLYRRAHHHYQGHSMDERETGPGWAREMGPGWVREIGPGWVREIVRACALSSFAFLADGLGVVVVVACYRLTLGLCQHSWQDHRFGVVLAPVALSPHLLAHLTDFSFNPFLACCHTIPQIYRRRHAPNGTTAIAFTHSKQDGPGP